MATYNNLATDNANVKFLTGTQASLNNLITNGGAVEGAFYLTEDTHRLYVGRTSGSKTIPVPVNEGVHIVATQDGLETASSASAGQMAYVSGDNILVINNGKAWVQLNPDTYLKADNNAVTVASSGTGKATVTTSVSDSANHKASGMFNITSGSNVTVSTGANNEISIGAKDTTTALNFAQAGDDNENTDLNVVATANNADGTNAEVSRSTVTFKKGTNMDSIAYDDTAKTITFNATDQSVDSVSASFSNTGVLSVGVKDKTGGQKSATVTPTISYGSGSTKSTATFKSGVASLNIYTKDEVDAAIQKVAQDAAGTADAMTFRGVISSSDQLPNIADAQNGDTYRIGANNITIGSWPTGGAILNTPYTTTPSVIKAGDVLVAVGTEDTTTGKIVSDGIWYLIPSGDDLQYSSYINDTAKDIAHGFELHDNSSALATVVGARLENTDGSISLEDSVDASNNKIKVITVKQKDDYTTQTLEATDGSYEQTKASGEGAATTEVKVIAGLAVDKYGNVTSATQETLKLVDSHANIKSVSSVLNVTDTAKAVINLTVTDTDSKSGTTSINLGSDTLSFASANGSLTANIKWGSF